MEIFGQSLAVGTALFLFLALFLALGFEFVNGFHDTANAVATVIYTKSLKAPVAVVWSGCWNLIGVLTSTGAVAFNIVALLPVELVLNVGSAAGFAMVFSLLISAILWNIGTWYFGLPASSTHTLTGAIMGVGLANSVITGHSFGEGVNWAQAQSVFTTLLISPIIGFGAAALLLLIAKATIKNPELYAAPDGDKAPPTWIRGLLILTCTGVSFAHGSNDGQKGMGLIMLIMLGVIPATFALNLETKPGDINSIVTASRSISTSMQAHAPAAKLTVADASKELDNYLKSSGKLSDNTYAALSVISKEIGDTLDHKNSFGDIAAAERTHVRNDAYLVSATIKKLDKGDKFANKAEDKAAMDYKKSLDTVSQFIPVWVKVAVALALGLGTMIGWKRIVVTVGEKIGKEHLTYAQGAAAELTAMTTIGMADHWGLPVSTTHVLSSGIAGTMAANKSGLQAGTLRNILLAWVLTLPVCVILGAGVFSATLYFIAHVMHIGYTGILF